METEKLGGMDSMVTSVFNHPTRSNTTPKHFIIFASQFNLDIGLNHKTNFIIKLNFTEKRNQKSYTRNKHERYTSFYGDSMEALYEKSKSR